MPWLPTPSADIHYLDLGVGPVMVLLHGSGIAAEGWYRQISAFNDRYRVVAYDSVNHGISSNSARGEAEPDRADELEAVLQHLGIEDPILVGQSMGGLTCLRWAIRYPGKAKALVITGMGIQTPEMPAPPSIGALAEEIVLLRLSTVSLTDAFQAAEPMLADRYFRLRSTATRIEAQRHPRPPTFANPGREAPELIAGLAGMDVPMLVVVGDLDFARSWAKLLHETVPHSRLEVLEGLAHDAYYEGADRFNAVLADFLDSLPA